MQFPDDRALDDEQAPHEADFTLNEPQQQIQTDPPMPNIANVPGHTQELFTSVPPSELRDTDILRLGDITK